jgi:hypothetical protein
MKVTASARPRSMKMTRCEWTEGERGTRRTSGKLANLEEL